MTTIVPEMEVSIGTHKYRVTRMSVFEQFNVAADYRDILVGLALVRGERPKDMTDEEYHNALQYIMASPAGLTSETRNRVTNICLRHVTRFSGGWMPVLAASQTLQFDDIDLPAILKLMYAVFEHNKLIDFFSASPSSSGGQETEKTGQVSQTEKTG